MTHSSQPQLARPFVGAMQAHSSSPSSKIVKVLCQTKYGSLVLVSTHSPHLQQNENDYKQQPPTQVSHKGRLVVVKVSDLQKAPHDSTTAEDPRREASILRALPEHPSVVRLLDAKVVQGGSKLTLTMPYHEGGDLYEWAKNRYEERPHSERLQEEAKFIFRRLLEGVLHLHRHKVCHLDISPENVLLTYDRCLSRPADPGETAKPPSTSGRVVGVRLCDFGAARLMEASPPSSSSSSSFLPIGAPEPHQKIPGKRFYMAPEVWQRRAFHGAPADVWSLGVVLVVLLTGNLPFTCPCPREDRNFRILCRTGKLPGALSRVVPPLAHSLIASLLQPSPADRPNLKSALAHPWLSSPSRIPTPLPTPAAHTAPSVAPRDTYPPPPPPSPPTPTRPDPPLSLSHSHSSPHQAYSSGTSLQQSARRRSGRHSPYQLSPSL